MKKLIALSIVLFATFSTFAQVRVSGYTRSNGTYVQPHYRSSPNYTRTDNYSTLGNVNPYTGVAGTKTYNSNNYSSTYKTPTYNYGSTYSAPVYRTTTVRYRRY